MRLAVVAVALFLLTSARAHADAIASVDLPELSLPDSSNASLSDDAIASPVPVTLPAETGAILFSGSTSTGVTPEPSSVVLMGSGLLGFGCLVWRRRVASRAVQESDS